MKWIIALLLSSFIGILSNPEMLMASDSVILSGVDATSVVETVPLPELVVTNMVEAEEEPVIAYAEPVYEIVYYATPAAEQPLAAEPAPAPIAPIPVAPAARNNSIQIAGRDLDIVDVSSTLVDSTDHVARYGSRFLYGHNSAAVFGGIVNMGTGSTFTMTQGGVTSTYRVMRAVIFEKNNGLLQINGVGNYMGRVAEAYFSGTQYDVSIMTCYGTMLPGNDATHRFVLFANRI